MKHGAASWLLVLGLVVAVYVPLMYTVAPQDDSYISYRYARNLVEGHGLVFNAGEEPVEGYTNFGWTVLIAAGMSVGIDPETLGPALGLLATLGAAYLVYRLGRLLGAPPMFAALGTLLFAVQPTQTVHAMSGLETSSFAFLVVLSVWLRVKRARTGREDILAGLSLGLAALTRPEGIMLFGLLEVAEVVQRMLGVTPRHGHSAPSWVSGVVRRVLPFVLIVGGHFLWRHATYGDWLPNTFYAKVAPGPVVWSDGLRYITNGIREFGVFLFVFPYLVLALRSGGQPVGEGRKPVGSLHEESTRGSRATVLFVSTAWLVYVASVGGDYMPYFRFLLPLIPLWCALAAAAMGLLSGRIGGAAGDRLAIGTFLLLGALGTWVGYLDGDYWPKQAQQHARLEAAGRKLDEVLPEEAWIAATNCGRIPYFARRRCIDMMGLSDKHIGRKPAAETETIFLEGHLKGDGGYVLDNKPEVIVFLRLVTTEKPLTANPDWPMAVRRQAFSISEAELARDVRLRQEYHLYSLPLPGQKVFMNVFARPGTFGKTPPTGLREAPWPRGR